MADLQSWEQAGEPASGQWHRFQTEKGLEVRVRPEQPTDTPYLVDLYQHLSPNSRYMRFGKAVTNPDPVRVEEEAERLARMEPPKDMAWLAFADLPSQPNAPVAGARYTRVSQDTAELAISVRDDLQRQGIGSQLLRFLQERAREDGIRFIVVNFRTDNRAVWRLIRHSQFPVDVQMRGPEVRAVVRLEEEVPKPPAD
jgi:acetyltransferase